MAARRATATQAEIARSIKAAVAAGLAVSRVEVEPRTGCVRIFTVEAGEASAPNPWDEVLR